MDETHGIQCACLYVFNTYEHLWESNELSTCFVEGWSLWLGGACVLLGAIIS